MIGEKVVHSVFGEGVIKEVKDCSKNYQKYITVEFKTVNKTFIFPDVFEKFLTTNSDSLKQQIQKASDGIKAEQEKERIEKEKEKARIEAQKAEENYINRCSITKSSQRTNKPFPQKCVITNEEMKIEQHEKSVSAKGYKIYGADSQLLGVVLADPKYHGRAVIRFRNEIKQIYGVWHLIQQDYSFARIETMIKSDGCINLLVE